MVPIERIAQGYGAILVETQIIGTVNQRRKRRFVPRRIAALGKTVTVAIIYTRIHSQFERDVENKVIGCIESEIFLSAPRFRTAKHIVLGREPFS